MLGFFNGFLCFVLFDFGFGFVLFFKVIKFRGGKNFKVNSADFLYDQIYILTVSYYPLIFQFSHLTSQILVFKERLLKFLLL